MEFRGIGPTGVFAPQQSQQESPAYSQMLESVLLARAALLSREGKLQEAELIVLPLANKANSRIDALDLLAKVYAQQGKIEEAQTLWLRALQREPSNKHFLRALLCCAQSLIPTT